MQDRNTQLGSRQDCFFKVSAVLDLVQVLMELDLSSPLDSSHNAEVYSVAIAAVKLCDHNEQLCFLPLSSFPQPQ